MHANSSSSSDKSPLQVWSRGNTKHSKENWNVLFVSENARQHFCEKMSTFGWSLGDTKHSKENQNVFWQAMKEKEDYSKVEWSGDRSFQIGTCIKGATREKY
jgi:hypothetical protein